MILRQIEAQRIFNGRRHLSIVQTHSSPQNILSTRNLVSTKPQRLAPDLGSAVPLTSNRIGITLHPSNEGKAPAVSR